MNNFEIFKALHHGQEPLLLGNAWDVQSATIFQKSGYKAIGTSSAAIARSLGYEDGENIPFRELLFIVEKIMPQMQIPVSVDMERGYGETAGQVVENIKKLIDLGVVGMNIEDSDASRPDRKLVPADQFRKKLEGIRNELVRNNLSFFINARTDAFILNLPSALEETLKRIESYSGAGADSIFVPFIKEEEIIGQITKASPLPINVLNIPGLPSYQRLAELGVKRISMGSGAFRASFRNLENLVSQIQSGKMISLLF